MSEALINPDNFPIKSEDLFPDQIDGSGGDVREIGAKVSTITHDTKDDWDGLKDPGVWENPDQDSAYTLLDPAVEDADEMKAVTDRVGSALEDYASTLKEIKPRLEALEKDARAFRTEALAGYEVETGYSERMRQEYGLPRTEHKSWEEHDPAVERNTELLTEFAKILEDVSTAAVTCATKIQGELTSKCIAPPQAITAEMILESPEASTWGYPTEGKKECHESVWDGGKNFVVGTVTGLASLIGRDPETGEWSWGAAGNAWWGVGDFVVSTAVATSPLSYAIGYGLGGEQWVNDRMNTAATAWGSLIGWDHQAHLAGEDGWHKWNEDGVATGTESLLNVGTFFIPGANFANGAGKAGKVANLGSKGAAVMNGAGRVLDFAVPGGSHLLKGGIKVIDLGIDAGKSGWTRLADELSPPTPLNLDGPAGNGLVPDVNSTPVSDSFGFNGAADANSPGASPVADLPGGMDAPSGVDVPSGVDAPSGGDAPGGADVPGGGAADAPSGGSPDAPSGGTPDAPSGTSPDSPTAGAAEVPTADAPSGGSPEVPTSNAVSESLGFEGQGSPEAPGSAADAQPNATSDAPTTPASDAPDTPSAGQAAEAADAAEAPKPAADAVENTPPDGTSVSPESPAPTYDPDAPVRETVPATEAPANYTPNDVQRALDEAPRNEAGNPVDHRNGRELVLENAAGDRGWVMRFDQESGSWVAENRGLNETGLPPKGEPGSYGYDADGNRLPYANSRPDYAPNQVQEVWDNSRNDQLELIAEGELDLPEPGENQMWVEAHPDAPRSGSIVEVDGRPWRLVEWDPQSTTPRQWDMGHLPGHEYRALQNDYLSGKISKEEFLSRFRNPELYRVEDPSRNRARLDEE